ncbi:MAG TPA: hypothetical protein VGE07_03650 [Herpetosiphonaceae bacterium]
MAAVQFGTIAAIDLAAGGSAIITRIDDILIFNLRLLIEQLGERGGIISPSIYDTAQATRFFPPRNLWPAVDWMLDQQRSDGGWGDPDTPQTRDVPTLSAILALQHHNNRSSTKKAIAAGAAFLRRQASQWAALPSTLPVGVELLLPRLLEEAAAAALPVAARPYQALIDLGQQRQALIRTRRIAPATPPIHSWEGWGAAPDPAVLDATGGVGHSPAATAAWLRLAANRDDLAAERTAAENYLRQAARSCGDVPGVVPTVWPISRFEQSFALYALGAAGLLGRPELTDVIEPQLASLERAVSPAGIGMSDHFLPDGDDTAAAIFALRSAGKPIDPAILRTFVHHGNRHFVAYTGELQSSLSLTARAIHALSGTAIDVAPFYQFVVERQAPDGRWLGDKWHSSWVYNTYHAVLALADSPYRDALSNAADALLAYHLADGGWGRDSHSTMTDTAYAALALVTLNRVLDLHEVNQHLMRRAYHWLLDHYKPFTVSGTAWIGKEAYQPFRIDLMFQLCAMLVLNTELKQREEQADD